MRRNHHSRMNQSLYDTSPSDEDSLAKTGSVKENISAVQSRETIEAECPSRSCSTGSYQNIYGENC